MIRNSYLQQQYIINKTRVIPNMEQQPSQNLIYNNRNKQMSEQCSDDFVLVQPQNVIVFYRNQYQSAATISITRLSSCTAVINYQLKTSNKKTYRVSKAKGTLLENQNREYIDIIINENAPLEQCLLDRFKFVLFLDNRSKTVQKIFKVIINYKKDSKIKTSNLNHLETSSRTSGSIASTSASVMPYTVLLTKKHSTKSSRYGNYGMQGSEVQKGNLKQQLDHLIKQVEAKKLRLEYLQSQHLKKTFRKRFRCYIIVIVIIVGFILGVLGRIGLNTTLKLIDYTL